MSVGFCFLSTNPGTPMPFSSPSDSVLAVFSTLIPAVHGGHDGGEGLVSLVDTLLSVISEGLAGGQSLLGGFALLGLNIHPMLVHFPIAFLTGYLLLDVFGLLTGAAGVRAFADRLLALGTVMALLTVATGLYAAYNVPHDAETHQIMVWHQRAGYLIAGLSVTLVVSRWLTGHAQDRMALTLNLLLNLLLLLGLIFGADLGATLVYGQGVGVKAQVLAGQQGQVDSPRPNPTP